MNKKILAGALVLGASTMFGLVGCGDNKDDATPETPKYSVIFDDNNAATEDTVVEFTQGETTLSDIPACPAHAENGFAGVWESFTLNDKDIVVNAKYGDGTEANPYMISNAEQFGKMIKISGKTARETEYSKEGAVASEAEATMKREFYQTCVVTYVKNNNAWKLSDITVTKKVHFKLISDIDLSTLQGDANGGEFMIFSLDGAKQDGGNYKITGVNGEKFRNTAGAMFKYISGSQISNVDIELSQNIATLASQVRPNSTIGYAKTTISNVSVSCNSGEQVFMSSDDNNEGPFVNFVMGNGTVLEMNNCVNNISIISSAPYFGIFVGGYVQTGSTVKFTNCVNNGNIISSGKVGIFLGHDNSYQPTIELENCEHNGSIKAFDATNSHVLAAKTSASPQIDISKYDESVENELTIGNNATITALEQKYELEVAGSVGEVVIVKATGNEKIDAGNYQLILSSMASCSGLSIVVNVTKEIVGVTGESVVDGDNADTQVKFTDVRFGMMDLNTYTSAYGHSAIPADSAANWIQLEGYNIRYFLDTANGYYVFDFTQYEEENYVSGIKLNTTKDNVKAMVVVRDVDGEAINFVVA